MAKSFLIHPILVHFPIDFYFLELVLLVRWVRTHDPNHLSFALFSFQMGYLFMVLAILAGLIDAGGFAHITGRVRTHFLAAATVFGFYTLRIFFWRFGKADATSYPLSHLLFAASGNILVAITGYFGGLLVYD